MFLSSRARKDTQTAVSFVTTRVKKTDEDDWGKLKRALKYLNGTRRLELNPYDRVHGGHQMVC